MFKRWIPWLLAIVMVLGVAGSAQMTATQSPDAQATDAMAATQSPAAMATDALGATQSPDAMATPAPMATDAMATDALSATQSPDAMATLAPMATDAMAADRITAETFGLRFGLGMVTSVGDVAAAAGDQAGYAQVNTVLAGVLLGADNRIVAVKWDVQRTSVNTNAQGGFVDYTAGELRRLDDANAFGLRADNANEAWFTPMGEFEQFLIGMTTDEALALDIQNPVAGQPMLPEITASEGGFVSVTRADYMEALSRAIDNAD